MNSPRKPFYKLSLQEQAELLGPTIEKLQQDNWDKGLYNVYLCSTDEKLLVRDYRDKQEIISVNEISGDTEIIETILKQQSE